MTNLSFGQRIDPTNGLVEPWLTNPAMDMIKTWDLAGKKVLEWGAGSSTLWWACKCKEVYSIEANEGWYTTVHNKMPAIGCSISFRPVNEGDQTKIEYYTEIPEHFNPDIVVVDGILRYECMLKALTLPRPLTLIVDNWQQDRVFICPAAEELMKEYEGKFYIQPDHTDHEGRPWCTAIWHLK